MLPQADSEIEVETQPSHREVEMREIPQLFSAISCASCPLQVENHDLIGASVKIAEVQVAVSETGGLEETNGARQAVDPSELVGQGGFRKNRCQISTREILGYEQGVAARQDSPGEGLGYGNMGGVEIAECLPFTKSGRVADSSFEGLSLFVWAAMCEVDLDDECANRRVPLWIDGELVR